MMFKINFLLLNLLFALKAFSQNNQLISIIQPDIYDNLEATNYLFAQPTTIHMHYIDLDLNILDDFNTFQLQFHNQNYEVNFKRKDDRGPKNFSWFGNNTDGNGSIIINVLGDDIQGIIRKGNNIYRILTTRKGSTAIVHIDQSKYPPESCFTTGALQPGPQKTSTNESTQKETNHIQQALANGCKITGLVMFTPAAEIAMKGSGDVMYTNIKNAIQEAVDDTNEAFVNSDITNYPPIELILVQKLNFVEDPDTTIGANLRAFRNTAEVNTLKDLYNADFCTLITDTVFGRSCGSGFVQANNNSAYNLVPYDCMIEQLSFAHEFGHLFGADHDVGSRPINISGDGHGYIHYPGRWRTIMSYNASPCGSAFSEFCFRQPYYSNPNVRYPEDNQPMGTIASENNARVCRDYYQTIAQFQQPLNNFILSNTTYSSNNNLYATIEAIQNITSSGSVEIIDSATLILKAGERIRLNNGFSTKTKGHVRIRIEQIEVCP